MAQNSGSNAIRQSSVDAYFTGRSIQLENGCREWTGPLKGAGYGQSPTRFGGGRYAHRAVYESVNGKIPSGMCVLHKCDNMKCINITHLFMGTQLDNIKDMHAKRRARFGSLSNERNPHCSISNETVIAMRTAWQSGISVTELSKQYQIHRAHCHRIVKNKARILGESK